MATIVSAETFDVRFASGHCIAPRDAGAGAEMTSQSIINFLYPSGKEWKK